MSSLNWVNSIDAGNRVLMEIEDQVLNCLSTLTGFNGKFGTLLPTGSTANLMALFAARESLRRQTSGEPTGENLSFRIVASEQRHASVDFAAKLLFGRDVAISSVATRRTGEMDSSALFVTIRKAVESGADGIIFVATAGTTSQGAIDPINAIIEAHIDVPFWLHVDGAYGGGAAISRSMHWAFAGLERANSFSLNPHKWLLTPMDVSCLLLREHSEDLFSTDSDASYLTLPVDGSQRARNGFEFTRMDRALKTYVALATVGTNFLSQEIERQISLAHEM